MTQDEILAHVRATIAELFEVDAARVTAEATVFEDLDLDSIDAIDLVARLQQLTGQRIDEDTMRTVRTVGDIVRILAEQLDEQSPGASSAAS